MTAPGSRTVAVCAAICLAAACSTVKETVQEATQKPTIPRTAENVAVSEVSERGAYVEATLGTEVPMRFYFAANETCRALLGEGKEVEYRSLGTFGEVAGGAGACPAEGIASVRTWHDRYHTRRTMTGKPREIVRFKNVYEDESVVMIRGRLTMAALLGMMSDDVIGVLPARSECRSLIEQGEAFMSYQRATGPHFHLSAGETRCEFVGFVKPIRN